MDLTTNYLGLKLRSPLVPSSSPMTEQLSNLKRMEECGAGAVVLPSLFEEELLRESLALHRHLSEGTESYAEATTYVPEPGSLQLGSDAYLEKIRQAKEALSIPVIASLNGTSLGGWTEFAKQIEQAGADALEVNVYYIPTEADLSGEAVEQKYVEILKAVKSVVTLPVAMKLSPFFSNIAHTAQRLHEHGADGLVLFNRFYQPDIDLDALEVRPQVQLSSSRDLTLPLRWVAILYGRLRCDLGASTGVNTGRDALKLLMAGASVTMVCGALLKKGVEHLKVIQDEMVEWLTTNDYASLRQMRGSMSQKSCENPSEFERTQYMRAIRSYRLS